MPSNGAWPVACAASLAIEPVCIDVIDGGGARTGRRVRFLESDKEVWMS